MNSENPLDNLKEPESVDSLESLVYLSSVDIVGSTALKQRNDSWQDIISSFFNEAREFVKDSSLNKPSGFKDWKFLGDEVVFRAHITSKSDIEKLSEDAYKILMHLAEHVETKDIGLSAKGTVWIVPVDNKQNIFISGEDYLGIHVDTGFRIAKAFSQQKQLALSFEIVYFIHKFHGHLERIFFLGYKELKGVWNQRLYPVFWYINETKNIKTKIPYDLPERCKLTRELITLIDANLRNHDIIEEIIPKINHPFLSDILNKCDIYLGEAHPETQGREFQLQKTELHNALVVIDSNKKILLNKRQSSRHIHPDTWACPGGHILPGESLRESCIRKAREELCITVNPITDVVVPYFIEPKPKHPLGINGFRVLCIADSVEIERLANNNDVKWFTIEEIENLESEGKTVPDISRQLKYLLKMHDSIEST